MILFCENANADPKSRKVHYCYAGIPVCFRGKTNAKVFQLCLGPATCAECLVLERKAKKQLQEEKPDA